MSLLMNVADYRTTLVCIDEYNDGAMKGRVYAPGAQNGTEFSNLMQFLLAIEGELDELNCPQSFAAKREFAPVEKPKVNGAVSKFEGSKATFAVKILFRQNASWQGSVSWLEGEKEESFRSVLELLLLMNSAMV